LKSTISIVIPMRNSAAHLPQVLPPLLAALESEEVLEVIVVDDASTDDSSEICRNAGLRVIPAGHWMGPSGCRNLGAASAKGDILLFVDSDVVMDPEVPARLQAAFERDPQCVAVFGSYDDRPAARTVVSLYKNLLHHFMHQQGREAARTFWAGCGAVDRKAFFEAGGFDGDRYLYPSIEDIELGRRLLHRGGRIILDKTIQATHLKRWTLRELVRTDVFRRALPWSRLILETGEEVNDLNVSSGEMVKAGLAGGLAVSVLAIPFLPYFGFIAGLLAVLAFMVNAPFFSLVLHRGGIAPMVGAFFLHQVYYLYSTATYIYCVTERMFASRSPVPVELLNVEQALPAEGGNPPGTYLRSKPPVVG
jgi:glycosyltransferase involved in cell wall biosynthesis